MAVSPTRIDRGLPQLAEPWRPRVVICKPADPEAKGLVERFHDYLERAFLPGRVFTSPEGATPNCRTGWCGPTTASIGCWGCRPADRGGRRTAAMLTLPPVAPSTGWRSSTRLPRDHYIRLDANDYSVHPSAVGRRIEIVADLDRVRVFSGGTVVADHDRVWAKHRTISDSEHVAAATVLRHNHLDVIGAQPMSRSSSGPSATTTPCSDSMGRWRDGREPPLAAET